MVRMNSKLLIMVYRVLLLLLLLSHFSRVQLLATPWTAAYQAPPSMGFFQARVLEWVAIAMLLIATIKNN